MPGQHLLCIIAIILFSSTNTFSADSALVILSSVSGKQWQFSVNYIHSLNKDETRGELLGSVYIALTELNGTSSVTKLIQFSSVQFSTIQLSSVGEMWKRLSSVTCDNICQNFTRTVTSHALHTRYIPRIWRDASQLGTTGCGRYGGRERIQWRIVDWIVAAASHTTMPSSSSSSAHLPAGLGILTRWSPPAAVTKDHIHRRILVFVRHC